MSTIEQPYAYLRHELVEPDWTRLPGWRHTSATQWASAQWQRVNCIKNIKGLRTLMGDLLTDAFYADTEALSREFVYYDPIYTLPEAGQAWWRGHGELDAVHAAAGARATASREASIAQLV